MKTYTANLKGTKKNGTTNISVSIKAETKSQAFNMAYYFFEKGNTDTVFGREETGFTTFSDYIQDAENLKDLAGKYFVPRTAIKTQKSN